MNDIDLRQGDCIEIMESIPDNSVDCIIIDPPYGINKEGILNDHNLDVYYKSLPNLFRILKDNCFFISFVGIGRLPEFFINNPFTYRWQYITYFNNGMARGSVGFSKYISALIFQKGDAKFKRALRDVYETYTTSQKCSKREHPTQKEIECIDNLILSFSKENDIILDCFMGSGSTGVSAVKNNRRFIGIELDKNYFKIAENRINRWKNQKGLKFYEGEK